MAAPRAEAGAAPALVALALQAGGRGDYEAALQLLARARAADPRNPEIPFREGLAQRARGDEAAALERFDAALVLAPGQPAVLNARGLALKGLGRDEEALAAYEQALARAPRFADALNNRAVLLRKLGRLEEAAAGFRAAIALQPGLAALHNNLGWTLHRLGRCEEALAAFAQALQLAPGEPEVLSNMGASLNELQRHDEAERCLQQALARDPGAWQTWMNLGVTRYGQRRHTEALEAYARAQALAPGEPDLLLNEGNALLELGRHAEARALYERARALRPQDAQVHMNLGNAWRQAQQHAQAWPHYEHALQLAPDDADVHFNFGLSLLAGGDYARGWRENEWRWRARGLRQAEPQFATPKWLGEQPIAGRRLLLHAEQGLGDTLMLCRYAVAAAERGARVLLQVQKPLVALLREALPQVEQVLAEDEPLPPHELHCPLMSLPLAFGTTLETIPQPPYLQLPAARVQHWRERLAGAPLNIGLAWAGNPKFAGDAGRSLDLATLLPALPEGPRYWCLQKDVPERDAAAFAASGIGRFEENGFADTAAQLLAMDLLVSTDTSIPHLAGALGCPTLLLLGFSSDFRWLADRSDSPWYPSLRLLRQPRPGDWGPPLDELRERLEALTRHPRAGAGPGHARSA